MDFINILIDSYNVPILTAFLLGVLTSVSPCPLATNITAIAYISKKIKNSKKTLLSGLSYTLGRASAYTLLATMIFFGFSSFEVSNFFQGWGEKVLGPVLVIIGLFMAGVFKINFDLGKLGGEKTKVYLAEKGVVGAFLLGALFALAFCPYSAVLFFGGLIPLVLNSGSGLFLPMVFAVGTGLPVIVFSFLIVFSIRKLDKTFKLVQNLEKFMRYVVAVTFVAVGVYYLQFTVKFLIGLF